MYILAFIHRKVKGLRRRFRKRQKGCCNVFSQKTAVKEFHKKQKENHAENYKKTLHSSAEFDTIKKKKTEGFEYGLHAGKSTVGK